MHNGQKVTITRGHDLHATIPEAFQKTDRGCPPFCVEPMRLMPGVETMGELEVLGYLKRMGEGDSSVLVVDSRTPDWVMRGTIPGSVNVPWTKINKDATGTFETPRSPRPSPTSWWTSSAPPRPPAAGTSARPRPWSCSVTASGARSHP